MSHNAADQLLRAFSCCAQFEQLSVYPWSMKNPFVSLEKRLVFARPALHVLPAQLSELLLQGDSLRIATASHKPDGSFASLPLLIAYWRPPTAFARDEQLNRAVHQLTDAGLEAINVAMRTMPPPTLAVSAGREQWAAWRLFAPIPDDVDALRVLARCAGALGSETPPRTLPIAGAVRSWNRHEHVAIVTAEPQRIYTLEYLESHFQETPHAHSAAGAEPHAGDSTGPRRRRKPGGEAASPR